MSKITLTRGYYISLAEDGVYTLMQSKHVTYNRGRKPKDGRTEGIAEKIVGYYSTLTGAVLGARKYAQKDVLQGKGDMSLREAVARLRGLDKEFREIVVGQKLDVGTEHFV